MKVQTNKVKKSVHLVQQGSTANFKDQRLAQIVRGAPIPMYQVQQDAFHARLTLKQLHRVQPHVSKVVIQVEVQEVVVQPVTRAPLDFT
jgi:sulfur transfer complex TusBCD TusB component (DsrH family)